MSSSPKANGFLDHLQRPSGCASTSLSNGFVVESLSPVGGNGGGFSHHSSSHALTSTAANNPGSSAPPLTSTSSAKSRASTNSNAREGVRGKATGSGDSGEAEGG
eukprot:CAMPEP_0175056100 /NCGR_PEP_ID=MMETSP0052_2-20121109/10471_1 /TAXON_ID=51329 ORGANISM="Polytomella parva, Strain SAG 63-3" /NCGR_SAMPLE_ID=MMETSP0052_2 /ASSEMBLY_ACC=CAM_ASM_000194 /LENGTH=104 /DNA_ID=CAMNT_0016321065 /DNA_START=339 /DNA_END=650 /DNA_ORIENTATION=+